MRVGAVKKAGDPNHPGKLSFLSFMVMELLGPSVGHLSLELQTYTTNLGLLVNHGLRMLKVASEILRWTCVRLCRLLVARQQTETHAQVMQCWQQAAPLHMQCWHMQQTQLAEQFFAWLDLQVLRFMHKHNIVHRDIKPDNFCLPMGVDPHNPTAVDTVYVVDMGMAQQIQQQGEQLPVYSTAQTS